MIVDAGVQRLLDERAVEVVGADALEVRGLGQGSQLVDETLLRRLTLGVVELDDRARVGVRVERVVGVLQRFEAAAELVVQQARQQFGEGLERLPLVVRYLVRAHRDDVGLAERDESLTGLRESFFTACTYPKERLRTCAHRSLSAERGTLTASRKWRCPLLDVRGHACRLLTSPSRSTGLGPGCGCLGGWPSRSRGSFG